MTITQCLLYPAVTFVVICIANSVSSTLQLFFPCSTLAQFRFWLTEYPFLQMTSSGQLWCSFPFSVICSKLGMRYNSCQWAVKKSELGCLWERFFFFISMQRDWMFSGKESGKDIFRNKIMISRCTYCVFWVVNW